MNTEKYNPTEWNPRIAEFLGVKVTKISLDVEYHIIDHGDGQTEVFSPDTDLNQAFMVVDKIEADHPELKELMRLGCKKGFLYMFFIPDANFKATHDSHQEAIYSAICAAISHLTKEK